MKYDSTASTLEHIQNVRNGISEVIKELLDSAKNHDSSKLGPEEKDIFDEFSTRLKNSTYGSEEYNGFLKTMKKALDHHYANNRHHPEFFENGIHGMNLLDLIELMVDWNAATKRHGNGDILKSIEKNQERFGYSDELKGILINTAHWLKEKSV